MQRRCSNCIHSKFEGYCGQMAVCDEWERRTPIADLLPAERQIQDEAKLSRYQASKAAKKSSRGKAKRSSSSRKKKSAADTASDFNAHRMHVVANKQRKEKRVKRIAEFAEPVHRFPRKGCKKKQILAEVRGWCEDHGYCYDDQYESESREQLIGRFICNALTSRGMKTGNYMPDPDKMARCFRPKADDAS